MHSNAKMEFLRKCVGSNGTLTSYMDLPLYIMYTLKYGDSLITDADKHALRPCYLLDLKIGR